MTDQNEPNTEKGQMLRIVTATIVFIVLGYMGMKLAEPATSAEEIQVPYYGR
jgi:hypothetical protein